MNPDQTVNESFPPVFETYNFLATQLRNGILGRYRLSNGEIFTITAETTFSDIAQAFARCRIIYMIVHK